MAPCSWPSRVCEIRERAARLTPRQAAALDLLAAGLSTRAIGAALGIAPGTAQSHLTTARATLGATSREQAAAIWREVRRASAA